MKKYFLLIGLSIMFVSNNKAQNNSLKTKFVNIESGINLSQFDFSNSDDQIAFINSAYSPSQHKSISVGFGLMSNLNFVLRLGYDKHQLIGQSIDMSNSHLSYDLNYMSTGLGLGYTSPNTLERLSLLLSTNIDYNYLLSGFQNIGSATYNLSQSDFPENVFDYSFGGGLLFQVTKSIGIYFKYDLRNTYNMKESGQPSKSYKITSHVRSIGLRINLSDSFKKNK